MGEPRLYTAFAPSPDGRFLLVSWLERPFSYTVPCGRFPKRIQLWDRCAPACRSSNAAPAEALTLSPAATFQFVGRASA